MTLHDHRGRFERQLTPFVDWCAERGVNPNALTAIALAATAAAGLAFYLSTPARWWLLVLGASLLGVGATLDSADGLLARTTENASPLGDYLDHAFDRFSDALLLVGLALSTWVSVEVGLFAIVGTLLTSYMGTQAQAVGVGRDYGGLLGRADRMFVLFWGSLIQAGLVVGGLGLPWGLNLVQVAVGWIAIAGNVTAVQRFWAAYRELDRDQENFK